MFGVVTRYDRVRFDPSNDPTTRAPGPPPTATEKPFPDPTAAAREGPALSVWLKLIRVFVFFQGMTYSEAADAPTLLTFHWEDDAGHAAIEASSPRRLDPPNPASTVVFFTEQQYLSSIQAWDKLDLPRVPTGFYTFLKDMILGYVYRGVVTGGVKSFGTQGGGQEWTAPKPVLIAPGTRFIKVP